MSCFLLSDLVHPIAHVVHIGAGMGRDLPTYLEGEPGTVTLVETDPDAIAQLESMARNHPEVTVIEAAVSANNRKRAFRRTNFPGLNSFRKPTGLKELFPGLRTLSEEVVKPVDPVHLIRDLDLSRDGSNLLVIEAPGEALGILKALKAADLLLDFDVIRLQEGREALYHRAPTAEDICSFLARLGYSAGFEAAPEDSERPYLIARLDRAALEATRQIDRLTATLVQVQTQCDHMGAEHSAAAQQAEELRARLAERDTQIETLQGQQGATARQAEELRARLAERDTQIEALQGQQGAAAQRAEKLRAGLDLAEREAQAMRDELAAAQQNLSVSLRLQMLHDTNLKDLQQRYASLLQSKDAQDELLERLTVSLSNAARYLQEMDDTAEGEAPVKTIRGKETSAGKAKPAIAAK